MQFLGGQQRKALGQVEIASGNQTRCAFRFPCDRIFRCLRPERDEAVSSIAAWRYLFLVQLFDDLGDQLGVILFQKIGDAVRLDLELFEVPRDQLPLPLAFLTGCQIEFGDSALASAESQSPSGCGSSCE